jgi:hypothetical protein
MAQFIGVGGMQHVAGIGIEHDCRIGRAGTGLMRLMRRLMRRARAVTRSRLAGIGRVDCHGDGECAEEAGDNARPPAQS